MQSHMEEIEQVDLAICHVTVPVVGRDRPVEGQVDVGLDIVKGRVDECSLGPL